MAEQQTGQPQDEKPRSAADEFSAQASASGKGLVGEFVDFLKHNKKWWLIPIVLLLVLLAAIIVLGSSVIAPFIYTLF